MKALITGITGQDGFYLSELLIDKGYEVYGLVRRSAQPKKIPAKITEIAGDVTDPSIVDIINDIKPDEIYHLAAQSHVGESFRIPNATFEINAIGTLNVLQGSLKAGSKFYQASTSELFGISVPKQDERTKFHPRSPYAVSKLAAFWSVVNFRESYGLFGCNGILFNHESPLRGEDFVTQKICRGIAKILNNESEFITLGNLNAKRDWGHAKDYVKGMWLMLQHGYPDDYVLATGETHSIKDFLTEAFLVAGISDWSRYVKIDQKFLRPADVPELCGNPEKAEKTLGWKREYDFRALVKEMMLAALQADRSHSFR